jgi:hypothetical protein
LAQQLLKDSQAIALAQRNLSSDSAATQKVREQQAAVAAAANNQLVLDNSTMSTSSPVQQPTGKQAQFNLMDADAQYILSLKESLPELLAPMKQSNKPGKWQDAHVRVAHLIHDSQIKDVQQKLADTIAKFETQNAGDLGNNQGVLQGVGGQNFQNLGNMGQNLNLAQNLAQNQSLDQAILMQLKHREAELKLQNSQLARQSSGTPNSKKRKTPTGGASSGQMASTSHQLNPSNHQLASQLQSSQNMVNSSSQNNNQSAKSIPSSGNASLRATPTGNNNGTNMLPSQQIPASLSGAISNSSGIASGMPNLGGNLVGNMSSQQFSQHQQQQAAANTALQAQALNFDNLEMTQAIAAALQQQQQLPTDVNVLQYLTAIDQMQAAGMKAPVSQTGSASTRTSGRGGKSSGIKQSSSSARLRQQAHAHAQQQQQAQQQAQQQVMLQQAALQMQLQQMQQHEAAQAAANAAAAKNKKS